MKKLHICLVGDNGIHFERWVKALSEKDEFKISAVTLRKGQEVDGVDYYYLKKYTSGKLDYILNITAFKKLVHRLKPDILHCHYASGYGFLGAMSGFHPFFLSVWGSDIVSFPNTLITRKIIDYTLKKADEIFATSKFLRQITNQYTTKKVHVVNFGIDTDLFSPHQIQNDQLLIGTVKSLHPQYGIHVLINAFKLLENDEAVDNLKLMIVGGGIQEQELKAQVDKLGLAEKVVFIGRVEHSEVPKYHNRMDIFVAVSINESFGVAVLEAQACAKPVVVSDVGGLPEVVEHGITGFIVPVNNAQATADALKTLIKDKIMREEMGIRGRSWVLQNFKWSKNVNEMCTLYRKLTI